VTEQTTDSLDVAAGALSAALDRELPDGWREWSPELKRQLLYRLQAKIEKERTDWDVRARDNQREPEGDWTIWLIMAGRGFGKTRTGAENLRKRVREGRTRENGIIGATAADTRDVLVEGPSGLLAVCPRDERPIYRPSLRRLEWPNGTITHTYSADEPDRLRGPQHDFVWGDEYAAWKRVKEATYNFRFGLRMTPPGGGSPQALLTTTPRPIPELRKLIKRRGVVITAGSTYENRENLADEFFEEVISEYEGTRLGEQELLGRLLEDIEGALWSSTWFERPGFRLDRSDAPDMVRVVVAMDPAASNTDESDHSGIVVVGEGIDGRYYVLHSQALRDTPRGRMEKVVELYREHYADHVVFETNNGGDYLPALLETVDDTVPSRVVHATRGKMTRAEPISSLYQKGRVSHVNMRPAGLPSRIWLPAGIETGHELLELQYVTYTGMPGDDSPDVMDAAVWALTDLAIDPPSFASDPFGYDDQRLHGRR
jgi:phage terminase large subunit-like protein